MLVSVGLGDKVELSNATVACHGHLPGPKAMSLITSHSNLFGSEHIKDNHEMGK